MEKKDYYEILGVKKGDDKETIKKAYKKLALKYHPDRAPEDKKQEYEQKFKEISEAYAVLSDDSKKNQYDTYGHNGFDRQYSQEDIFRGTDFSSIFEDLFGGSFFNNFRERNFYEREEVADDLRYKLTIEFEEAVFGVEKEIEIKRDILCDKCEGTGAKNKEFVKCDKCSGKGRINIEQRTPFGIIRQTRICSSCSGSGKIPKQICPSCSGKGILNKKEKMKIKIPAGINNNQTLRVQNSGNEIYEGETGDLLLFINVKPHKFFQRNGDDISLDFEISFSQAALGSTVLVPTLYGNTKIKIPAGIQSNTVLRLKGKGIKNVSYYNTGDQFINIKVKTPKNLSKEQKKLFKELEKLT